MIGWHTLLFVTLTEFSLNYFETLQIYELDRPYIKKPPKRRTHHIYTRGKKIMICWSKITLLYFFSYENQVFMRWNIHHCKQEKILSSPILTLPLFSLVWAFFIRHSTACLHLWLHYFFNFNLKLEKIYANFNDKIVKS